MKDLLLASLQNVVRIDSLNDQSDFANICDTLRRTLFQIGSIGLSCGEYLGINTSVMLCDSAKLLVLFDTCVGKLSRNARIFFPGFLSHMCIRNSQTSLIFEFSLNSTTSFPFIG